MRHPTFDLDVLRTFVTGVEFNSFAKAADRLGRSTSAVSAQLKKLEEQVGSPVLAKAGRGLALTPVGEALLGHARHLLQLNDDIFATLHASQLQGAVRLGLQEDFGEHLLGEVLQRFARLYPMAQLEVRLGRSGELQGLIEADRIDLALVWENATRTPYSARIGETAMCWIGARNGPALAAQSPLPLVLFDSPCVLRSIATRVLDDAQMAWRVALTSPSVAGIWAAVGAGLGITVRTRIGLPAHLQVLQELPALPPLGYVLHYASEQPAPAVLELARLIEASLVQ